MAILRGFGRADGFAHATQPRPRPIDIALVIIGPTILVGLGMPPAEVSGVRLWVSWPDVHLELWHGGGLESRGPGFLFFLSRVQPTVFSSYSTHWACPRI
jgi:hypothetical protein